jgi:hypothetical protein
MARVQAAGSKTVQYPPLPLTPARGTGTTACPPELRDSLALEPV